MVIQSYPTVPNLATILSFILATSQYFTVVDLSSALFSIPIHPDFLFAFQYDGLQLTWHFLPQGYCESPSIFSQFLKQDLANIVFPKESTLIQYVDDLLLASPTMEACLTDSMVLLQSLAVKGHKTSKSKLQFCLPQVTYLCVLLSHGSCSILPPYVQTILQCPKSTTRKAMHSFLGMVGFCH